MHEIFFFIALVVGIVGGFVLWDMKRDKQRSLIRSWRKQREKQKKN